MARVIGPGNIQITSPSVAAPVRANATAFGAPQAEALADAGQAVQRIGAAVQRIKDEQQDATDAAFLDRYDLETDLSFGTATDEEERNAGAGADGLTERVRQRLDNDAPGILDKVRATGLQPSEKALAKAESIRLRRQHQYTRRAAVYETNERVRNYSVQLDASLGTIAQRGVQGGDIDGALTRAEQSIEAHAGVLPPAELDKARVRAARHFLEQIKAGADPDDLEGIVTRLMRGGEEPATPAEGAAAAAGRSEGGVGAPPRPSGRNDAIARAAAATGADEALMRTFSRIESGDRPGAQTGSYKGRFQLSEAEFRKYGGKGSIFDDDENSAAAGRKIVAEARAFETRHGRKPSALDLYLVHQQGEAGYDAHMARPGALAWQNMAGTGEGRRKGSAWAKKAIWGNIPDDMKRRFGSVENVTSADFVNVWREKVARMGGGAAVMAGQPATLRGELAREVAADLPAFQKVIEKRREQRELQTRARAIIAGEQPADPESKADQKSLDAVMEATDIPARLGEADPAAAGQLTAFVQRTGYVPDAAISQLRATSTNGTPEQRAFALETAANILRQKPGALEGTDKSKALRGDAQLYETLTLEAGISQQDALARIAEMRSPEFERRKEAMKKELAEGGSTSPIAQLAPGDLAADYDGWFTSPPELGGSPRQASVVFDTYRDLVKNHYVRTGDIEVAKSLAKKDLKRTYDVSDITGNRRLMRHPPEAYYPKIEPRAGKEPSLSYFSDQLSAAVNDWRREGARQFGQDNPEARAASAAKLQSLEDVPLSDIFLEPVPQTNADIAAGRLPGYAVVWFEEKDGQRIMNTAPGMVFRADVKAARAREQANRQERFRYARERALMAEQRDLPAGMGGSGADPLGTDGGPTLNYGGE
jgi:hypothetical protein